MPAWSLNYYRQVRFAIVSGVNIHRVFGVLIRPFRKRRMRRFSEAFDLGPATRVLDLGGTSFNWKLLDRLPGLTLANVHPSRDPDLPCASYIVADGRNLPFRDQSFEIVFSNSVIEHVGNLDDQRSFANECRRVGREYFVQTPNRGFFLEPHLLTPFFHWLPATIQRSTIRFLTVRSWLARPTREWCDHFLATTRLLDAGQFQDLFPDGELRRERVLGMTKALIAIRRSETEAVPVVPRA